MEQLSTYEENQLSVIVFEVGGEEFVINLLDVKEIIQTGQIRRLPRGYDFIEGIYNYRGNIIHIINLRKKLNLEAVSIYGRERSATSSKQFIIIVNINNVDIGFSVDKIITISSIEMKDIVGLSPIIQTGVGNLDCINGIVKFKEKPRIFLDLHKILSDAEKISIKKEQGSSII